MAHRKIDGTMYDVQRVMYNCSAYWRLWDMGYTCAERRGPWAVMRHEIEPHESVEGAMQLKRG